MSPLKTLALGAAILLAGCSWIRHTPDADQVRVVGAGDVRGCQAVGTTTVSLLHRTPELLNDAGKLRQALERLARNAAVQFKGDTVVPAGPVSNGEQSFRLYHCR